jgi:predicted RNase H-like nuclease (RuvC/YqgF family)
VWSKSDDCSDNRNKRNGLRDAASDAWSAGQNLEKAQRQFPELQDALEPLRLDINALHHSLKSLADIMGKNPRLDHEIDKNHSRAKELLARLAPILEMYRGRATHDSERVKALEATRRSLLENSEQQPAIQNGTT